MTASTTPNPSRRDFRSLVFHLLYAMESYDYTVPLDTIICSYNQEFCTDIPLEGEIVDVVTAVVEKRHELDIALQPLLSNWRLERLGTCTLLVLRLAIWEMLYTDTPSTIIINEGIELAKCFSERDAYKFVNGILDEGAKRLRKAD